MRAILFCLTIILFVIGCKSDPYPEDGVITSTPPIIAVPPPSHLVIDGPDVMEFSEGIESRFPLNILFKGNKVSNYSFYNKPEGMTYDEENDELSWKPDFDEVIIGDAGKIYKTINFSVEATRPDSGNALVTKDFKLVVFNNQQNININDVSTVFKGKEGERFDFEFEINSKDYPNGPFDISYNKMMPGAEVEIDGNKVNISYKPNFFVYELGVFANYCSSNCLISFIPQFQIRSPDNNLIRKTFNFKFEDVRQKPVFELISEIETNGSSISFDISSHDPNGEQPPKIQIESSSIKTDEGDESISEVYVTDIDGDIKIKARTSKFSWDNIPATLIGESREVTIESCTFSSSVFSYNNCVEKKVLIKVTGKRDDIPSVSYTHLTLPTKA